MRYLALFFLVATLKFCLYSIFVLDLGGFSLGGNDADYYDAYALGAESAISSAWPSILRLLNEIGLYSRVAVSFIFIILAFFIVPWMCGKLSQVRDAPNQKVFLTTCLIVSLYPTIFYYALDIYRDVLMLCFFLVALLMVRAVIEEGTRLKKGFAFISVCLLSFLMYGFRSYLGLAFIVSFGLFWFFDIKRFNIILLVFICLLSLNVMFYIGLFDSIMAYRALFDDVDGGTSLGLRFESTQTFIPIFIKSFIFQMIGFFFPNRMALIAFLLEGAPFILFLIYFIRNRQYSNKFVNFLVVFFVVYSVIWLLGNDNLGTAMRLRMYNYISVLVAFMIVYQRKRRTKEYFY